MIINNNILYEHKYVILMPLSTNAHQYKCYLEVMLCNTNSA